MNTVLSSVGSSSTGLMIPITLNHVFPRYSWMWPVRWEMSSVWAACAPSTTVGKCSFAELRKWPAASDVPTTRSMFVPAASTPIPPVCSAGTYGVRNTFTFATEYTATALLTFCMWSIIGTEVSGSTSLAPKKVVPGVTVSRFVPSASISARRFA